MKWLLILSAACASIVLLMLGCGKSSHTRTVEPIPVAQSEQSRAPRSLEGILAQIDAYQPPGSVDHKLFNQLRAQLRETIVRQWGSKHTLSLYEPDWCEGYNMVQDLERTSDADEPVRLKWSYRNIGDYDQNGVVAIEDVTPVAVHYGESKAAGTWKSMTKSLMPAGSCSSIRAALWA